MMKLALVHQAFAWNRGYREYFAVKATPTPGILKYYRIPAVVILGIGHIGIHLGIGVESMDD
ncbi:MAG: hypothetical protein ACI3XR_00350 [Eubacteriales bacterium]